MNTANENESFSAGNPFFEDSRHTLKRGEDVCVIAHVKQKKGVDDEKCLTMFCRQDRSEKVNVIEGCVSTEKKYF